MPLEFHDAVVLNKMGTRVKFAGYPDKFGRPQHVCICEITADTLCEIGNTHARGATLLALFERHKLMIFEAASRLYDQGHTRPLVDKENFGTDRP